MKSSKDPTTLGCSCFGPHHLNKESLLGQSQRVAKKIWNSSYRENGRTSLPRCLAGKVLAREAHEVRRGPGKEKEILIGPWRAWSSPDRESPRPPLHLSGFLARRQHRIDCSSSICGRGAGSNSQCPK